MKRYTLLSLLLVLALAFTACAPSGGAPAAPAEEAAAPAEEAAAEEAAAAPDLPFEVAPEAVNPFGWNRATEVEGIFFEGGFGRGYLDNAADIFRALHPDNSDDRRRHPARRRPASPTLHRRRPAGRDRQQRRRQPGHGAPWSPKASCWIWPPLFDAPSLDTPGKTFGETLFPGSQDTGMFDGVQRYPAPVLHRLRHLAQRRGSSRRWAGNIPRPGTRCLSLATWCWKPPTCTPGPIRASIPQYMVFGVLMPLVYKNGGIEAIIAMDNLEEGAFSTDAVQQVAGADPGALHPRPHHARHRGPDAHRGPGRMAAEARLSSSPAAPGWKTRCAT